MKKLLAVLLCVCMLLGCAMTSFATDLSYIQDDKLSYEDYYRDEHGFYEDENTQKSTYLQYMQKGGKKLFALDEGWMLYGKQRVSGVVGNSEMVFFAVGSTIYRYHIYSRSVDAVFAIVT